MGVLPGRLSFPPRVSKRGISTDGKLVVVIIIVEEQLRFVVVESSDPLAMLQFVSSRFGLLLLSSERDSGLTSGLSLLDRKGMQER